LIVSRAHLIRVILGSTEENVPKKYQNPKLELREDGNRPYYCIRVSVPSRKHVDGGKKKSRERRILGFADEITKKQAMQLRAELLEVINAGRLLVQSQYKFKEVAKRFLDVRLPQLGVATQAKYRCQIANHLLPAFAELRMCDIDRPRVEAWLNDKAETLGWWSRIDLKGVLSAIFTTAKGWRIYDGDNPTEGVRIGRKRLVREKRLLTAEQLRSIFAALDPECRFLVQILFGLGLNISEALGLRWSDVELDAGTVEINRRWYRGDLSDEGETKTENRVRKLQLGALLSKEFKDRYPGAHKRGAFVFVGDYGHSPPDERDLLRERFRPVVKRLGLYYVGFGWHAFRRQNITWRQTIGGATPLEAQRAAGHGSIDMTLLYTLEDSGRQVQQVDAMFAKLMEMPEGKPQ
jgi:integrase